MANIFQPYGEGLTPTGVRTGGLWDALARSGFGEVIAQSINRGLAEGTRKRERTEDITRDDARYGDSKSKDAVSLLMQLMETDPTIKEGMQKASVANPEMAANFQRLGINLDAVPTRKPTLQETKTQADIAQTQASTTATTVGTDIAQSQERRAQRQAIRAERMQDAELSGALMVTGADGKERVATPREIAMYQSEKGLPKEYKNVRLAGEMEQKISDVAKAWGGDENAKKAAQKFLLDNPFALQSAELRTAELGDDVAQQGIEQSKALTELYRAQVGFYQAGGKAGKGKGDADGDGEIDRKESDLRQASEHYGTTLNKFFDGLGGDFNAGDPKGLAVDEIIALIDPTDAVGYDWLARYGVRLPKTPNDPEAAREAVDAVLEAHGLDPEKDRLSVKGADGKSFEMDRNQLTRYVVNARQQIDLSKGMLQGGTPGNVGVPEGWNDRMMKQTTMGDIMPEIGHDALQGGVTPGSPIPGMDPGTAQLLQELQRMRDEDMAALGGAVP